MRKFSQPVPRAGWRHSPIQRTSSTTLTAVASPISSDGLRSAAKHGVRLGATATARWRDGPDLVIVGVKRGGTTSLFRDLERHPAMCPLVPSAGRLPLRENQKGVHYFDTGFDHSDRWYRSHFPTRMSQRHRARRVGAAFTAEASPYYFFQPLAAERVAAALPDSHFVVLLRDPVERTISHWSEQTRNGVETLSLSDAVDIESTRVADSEARLERGEIVTSHPHEQQSYAAQSMYATSLRRWFDAVGRERMLVAFSEDYYRDPGSVIDSITDRLGMARMTQRNSGDHRNAAPRNGAIDARIETTLVERFRPDVDAVTELLGARPPWPRFDGPDST